MEEERFTAGLTHWKAAPFAATNEEDARVIRDALASSDYIVSMLETVEKLDKPDAPFKTSTLQQQGAIRLRFSGKRTMKIAQELYEGMDVGGDGPTGLITYMRTDSLRVSDESVTGVREKIARSHGGDISKHIAETNRIADKHRAKLNVRLVPVPKVADSRNGTRG